MFSIQINCEWESLNGKVKTLIPIDDDKKETNKRTLNDGSTGPQP